MELFTRSYDKEWNRIVHIYVEQCEGVSEYINDKDTYKILTLDKGSISYMHEGMKRMVSAPAVFMLTTEPLSFVAGKGVSTTTVFLKPTEIREEFTVDRIKSGEFEKDMGRTIYQDYLLLKSFEKESDKPGTVLIPGMSAYERIIKIVRLMNKELVEQSDGYWPCRSRSYMLELLSFIGYVCDRPAVHIMNTQIEDVKAISDLCIRFSEVDASRGDDTVGEIIQYLSERISEKVTLDDILKDFPMNRNRLNELFVKETSMTCLNYFAKMRINLAQIMLAETELQIGEIAGRVGYEDANYFIKVFKKMTGVTPSKYRETYS